MLHRFSLIFASAILICAVARGDEKENSRIARISFLEGHVSFQHSGDVDWTAAGINMALQPEDRIYTGADGRAEIEFDDGSVLRLAEKTDVEILVMSDDRIQVRLLVGLTTVTVRSGVDFEINTPAAAFNTLRKGVYRFDVAENGDSDGIVRKGLLEGANNTSSQRAESGELVHATPGDQGTTVLAKYDRRDDWDEWNDRRNAEMNAYESRRYLPEHVSIGVRDLDLYGRWVEVEYGSAWVPLHVDSGWSPYWEGRWVYRPFWGWTWVSYEPWGWLPYHYGRWHHHARYGWTWLPGPSFGFHFWSPGLVRFYHGPSWVSWCPLGPGDYYNVNRYHYNRAYHYQLNNLRLVQRRSPDDLVNRHVPGAFRTSPTDHFLNNGFGRNANVVRVADADDPWRRGRMITDQLPLRPTARSFSPAPDRAAARPLSASTRPVVVRTDPGTRAVASPERFTRITNPSIGPVPRSLGRTVPGGSPESRGGQVIGTGSSVEAGEGERSPSSPVGRGSSWNRRPQQSNQPVPSYDTGRTIQSNPQVPRSEGSRSIGRDVPGNTGSRRIETPNVPSTIDRSRGSGREAPSPSARPNSDTPRRMESSPSPAPRIDRPAVPERRVEPQRQQQEPRPRPSASSSFGYVPRSYASPAESRPRPSVSSSFESTPRSYSSQQESRTYQSQSYGSPMSRSSGSGSWSSGRSAQTGSRQGSGRSEAPSWGRSTFGGRNSSAPATINSPSRGGFGGGGMRSAPSSRPSGGGSGMSRRRGR